MKATWLLLVVVLFFGACAKTTATMPNNLAQVNVENSDDLAFLEAFDALNRGDEEVAFEKFFALYKKTGSLICAKEALKLAFVLRNDKLDLLVQVARKQMSKDSDVLRILAGYELQNLKIANAKKIIKKLVAMEPNSAVNYSILGTIYVLEDSKDLALFAFKKAYSLEPSEINLLKLVDMLANVLNRQKEAISFASDWVSKYGCTKQTCLVLLGLYAANEDSTNMAAVYSMLYDSFGGENFLRDGLSVLLFKRDFAGARALLEKYRFDDGVLMELYSQLGLFENAYKLASELYENSKEPSYLARMAIYKYENAGSKPSKELLAQVVELFERSVYESKDAVFYNYYGYLLINHDIDAKKGLELALKAHELDTAALFIIDSVAWGYYKLGECESAKEWIERVLIDKEFASSDEVKEHLDAINKCIMEQK